MAEARADRSPTRDYQSLSETPWTLWDVMFTRRSCRKYAKGAPDKEFGSRLNELVKLATETRGAPGAVLPITDPGLASRVRQSCYKGFSNKINIWLARAPVHSFIAPVVPVEDVKADRPRITPKACTAIEDTVLWLTSLGLGTCWLGGVNSAELCRVLGLDAGLSVPLVVCVGKPYGATTISFDNLMRNTLSRKRKPLSAVACVETLERRYQPAELVAGGYAASSVQDVEGLLGLIRDGSDDDGAPLGLAVEACLEAARIAPSAGNRQSWHFAVVGETARLEQLALACDAEATWRAAIVAAGTATPYMGGFIDKPFWMVDVPIALSHMSLMAASMGCRATVHTDIDEPAVNRLTAATKDVRAVGVMGII